ncbi:hypothetical protein VTK56DRAFT_2118 [Thermocarpiscus australiensis]
MQLTPLALAASLLAAPATHAFLLPPEVSEADAQTARDLAFIRPQTADIVVGLECPGCPVLVKGKHRKAKQLQTDRPNHLELTLSIDQQPDYDRLLVNGFELYPGYGLLDVLAAPQIIDQATDGLDTEKRHDRDHRRNRGGRHRKRPHRYEPLPQRLGFGLHVNAGKKDADAELELVEVDFQVIEVGSTFIRGIPNLKVKLVKDGNGRLLITQIEKTASNTPQELPGNGSQECSTLWCRLMAVGGERLRKLKPFRHCQGHYKGGMASASEAHQSHDHPHHHHAPGPQHVRYHRHSWDQLARNIAFHILLPVLIGIVAGLAVSLFGMAVGAIIVSLWRVSFRRRHHRHRRHHSGHAHHKAAQKEAAVAEEKSGLMDHQDPPPSYEEEETVKPAQV